MTKRVIRHNIKHMRTHMLVCHEICKTFAHYRRFKEKLTVTREWMFASLKLIYTMVQFNVIDMVTQFNDVRTW